MSKYLGPPSKIRQPDFLKTLDHPTGFAIEQARDQLKKELCEENRIALRDIVQNLALAI
ncbi:hypothetical protein RhiirA4_476031 [Rhizophagus irregularis]|uniref:Uncharacterized protein n=1 Tax=Rhizophagus irregularis TaxID=588596 RepID=A0A2I1HAZ9_9GLOM|nr:hypothetical protein RhiirA4_476031 [Rhizophagus irregularis]